MHVYTLSTAALLAAALTAASCQQSDSATAPQPPVEQFVTVEAGTRIPNTLDDVIDDMTGAHEGAPRGVPADGGVAWAWVYRPRIGYGNEPPAGWNATIPWGQVYADDSGARTTQARFQIRNMRQYMLSRADSTWRLIAAEPDSIAGANYAEDFVDDANVPAGIEPEPDRGGGISASVADGYNFHFFARSRVEIDPTDVAGMYSVFEVRLLPGTQIHPDGNSHLLASGGGDYWESLSAPWDQWTTNGDWAIGRMRYITPDWQSVNAHTLDAATLRRYPPPGLD